MIQPPIQITIYHTDGQVDKPYPPIKRTTNKYEVLPRLDNCKNVHTAGNNKPNNPLY